MDPTTAQAKTLEDLLNELTDSAVLAKKQHARAFLDRNVFDGVADLKPSFDSASIKHFNAADFATVVSRCSLHNVRIIGIEVFTREAELLYVEIAREHSCSNVWCVELLERFKHQTSVSYCATYDVPRNDAASR